jgi:anaerobic selenocysteine-containing dehydrogenase
MAVTEAPTTSDAPGWKQTACILCECNCGIEVRLGSSVDGRRFERIRGDKAHPSSRGYTCEKALRLDHYQNPGGTPLAAGPRVPARGERVTHPLRRRADGSFEVVDWETAIRDVADRLAAVRDAHGGASIFYFGGGGQGNHLGGAYGSCTMQAFGGRYRSNALAQEKTGEFWVNGKVLGTNVRGDIEHCEVALFVGKNPWQSHGFPRARTTLKEIARDPDRALIVVDPRRTETAELADIHLQVRPGADAWLVSALAAAVVDEGLVDHAWLADHATPAGTEAVLDALRQVDIAGHCTVSGVDEALVRRAARRIGEAASVGVAEDLGIQMNLHSTLVSYLEKLVWLLTGNFGRAGTQYAPSSLVPLGKVRRAEVSEGDTAPRSPVVGARIVSGLVPCNVIADEILTDHPARYRAMVVESGNPAHSLADSQRMREALAALDTLVVIDVFLTETARLADYVLPAPTQFEKWEATFFNFEFPRNVFHLRRPVLDPPDGPLPEPEIHARLVEASGALDGAEAELEALREAATTGRAAFAEAFFGALAARPELGPLAPVVLYRTLGPTLPHGAAAAAALWGAAHRCAQANPDSVRRAGYGEGFEAGERLFDAILDSPSGAVITDDAGDEEAVWRRLGTGDGLIHLDMPELLAELAGLAGEAPPGADGDGEWPFVLSAGERRSFSANTIIRDPAWRKRDAAGALRVHPADAARLGLVDGGPARLTTKRASVAVTVELHDSMHPGHLSLPNGLGVDHPADGGEAVVTGIAPNELTASGDRDPWVGTPHHKHVPARLEPLVPPADAARMSA